MKYITYTLPNDPTTTIFETETCIAVEICPTEQGNCINLYPVFHNKIFQQPVDTLLWDNSSMDEAISRVKSTLNEATFREIVPEINPVVNIIDIHIPSFANRELRIRLYDCENIATVTVSSRSNSDSSPVSFTFLIGRDYENRYVTQAGLDTSEPINTRSIQYDVKTNIVFEKRSDDDIKCDDNYWDAY